MKIQILGNGGAINDGLPYNAFLVNGSLLCEAPPDIMLSLHRNHVDLAAIRTIYISHLHGDHCFGLPFLILSAFFDQNTQGRNFSFTIFGPQGILEMADNLVASAFSVQHGCYHWMKQFCQFQVIDETSTPHLLDGYQASLFALQHFAPTYGFCLANPAGGVELAYVADTLWCEAICQVIEKQPRVVLIDLNGKDDEIYPVHVSLSDLVKKGLPITGPNTRYYGTHLKQEFDSPAVYIECARPGMVIHEVVD